MAPRRFDPPRERGERIVDQHVRSAYGLRNDRAPGAGGERRIDELVTVMDGARHGDEQVARADFAAVEGHACDLERRARRPAGRSRDLVGGPEAQAAHSRATSASSNGSTLSPITWPVSWPLPATSTISPARAMRIASAIASRRPGTSIAPGAPAMIAERITAGSSLRGLSSVTIATSERRIATAPICGRLP